MELKDLYSKLDQMNEHVSKLRETTARTEAVLERVLADYNTRTEHLEVKVDTITTQQNQWKGAMIVISALFSIVSTAVARILFK